jgi:hypothetical protein
MWWDQLPGVQMHGQYWIQRAAPYLSGSKFPSNHLKLERSPGVMTLRQACGVVTVAQLSSGKCRYDPHFPSLYTFMTRSLFSCWLYSGKFTSNGGAEVSRIKKHLKQHETYFRFLYSDVPYALMLLYIAVLKVMREQKTNKCSFFYTSNTKYFNHPSRSIIITSSFE